MLGRAIPGHQVDCGDEVCYSGRRLTWKGAIGVGSMMELLAWKEALARVLADFRREDNVSPPWLVNPETNRRLKLDQYYPEIGFAVQFTGLQSRQQRRQLSERESLTAARREQIRVELCHQHGVVLFSVNVYDHDRAAGVDRLLLALMKVSRRLRRGKLAQRQKVQLLSLLADARDRASALRQQLHSQQGMTSLAEAWRDRQTRLEMEAKQSALLPSSGSMAHYRLGEIVEHERFGRGVIIALEGVGGEAIMTVRFSQEFGERSFLLALAGEKLRPVSP